LFEKYHDLNFSEFSKIQSGEIIRNLTKEISLYCSGFASFIYMLSETFILFILLMLLLYVDIKATLAVIVILTIFAFLLLKITFSRLSNLGQLRAKAEKDKVQNILGFIRLFPETKLYQALPSIKPLFSSLTATASKSQALFNFFGQIPRIFLELAAFSVLGILLIVSFYYNYSDQKMLILISVFGVVGLRVLPSISRLVNTAQVVRYNTTSKNIIDNIFLNIDKISKSDKKNNPHIYIKNSNKTHSLLEINNFSFSFSKKSKLLFEKLTFKVKSGNPVCISAPSGKGKSTLLEVISGLREPNSGNMVFHKAQNNESIKPKIAYVGQRVFLFPASIKENLLFGNKLQISDNEIWQSLKVCDMYSFIKNIGLNFEVDEDGNSFSGGQIQRLGLARAILNKPNILILDEVTAGLDEEIEKKVIENLHEFLNKAIVIHASHSQIVKVNCTEEIILK